MANEIKCTDPARRPYPRQTWKHDWVYALNIQGKISETRREDMAALATQRTCADCGVQQSRVWR